MIPVGAESAEVPLGRLPVVQIRELTIPDAYEITPKQLGDDRGVFLEWYRFDRLEEAIGHPLDAARRPTPRCRSAGVVRGIHFADVPPGQAKYVTATHGAVLDYVIDIRVGSPTFGQWDTVLLDDVDRKAIYLAEGLGHAFVALTDDATVSYLVTRRLQPDARARHQPARRRDRARASRPRPASLLLSPKDPEAPTLAEAAASGLLPTWDDARAFYASLNGGTDA